MYKMKKFDLIIKILTIVVIILYIYAFTIIINTILNNQSDKINAVKKEAPPTFQESLDSISLPVIAITDLEQKLLKLSQEVQNKINDLLLREKAVIEAEKKSNTYLITCFCDDCEGSPVEDFTKEEYEEYVRMFITEKKHEEDHHNRRGLRGRRRR